MQMSFSQPVSDSFMRDLRIFRYSLPSSCYDERVNEFGQSVEPNMLILHCSSKTPAKILGVLKGRGLSAHYIIGTNGCIVQCVDECKRAWHAIGEWQGVNSINTHSIGIEIENPTYGHSTNYSEAQVSAIQKLCTCIMAHYHIQPHNVLGHSDVAPTRKPDPGRLFPWQKLAEFGIGVWPNETAKLSSENDVEKLLQAIGYPTQVFTVKKEDTTEIIEKKRKIALNAALYAFKRHYMPQEIADNEMPGKDQYQYLRDFGSDLPVVLDNQPPVDQKTISCLKNVAWAYKMSRSEI